MAENTKNAGQTPNAGEIFEATPAEGAKIKAKFDQYGVLEWAVILDEKKGIAVRITRSDDYFIFYAKWGDFSVQLRKEYSLILPGIFNKDVFIRDFSTPLEYYKALLNIIRMMVEEQYEIAQSVYEEEQKELEG